MDKLFEVVFKDQGKGKQIDPLVAPDINGARTNTSVVEAAYVMGKEADLYIKKMNAA